MALGAHAKLKKTIATFIVLELLLIGLFFAVTPRTEKVAQVVNASSSPPEWSRTYGGPGDEEACSLIQTKDGGCVMAGCTPSVDEGWRDMYLVKTDGGGNVEWTRTYGTFGFASIGRSVIQTSDGGYAIVGEIIFLSGNSGYDAYLVKTDANGNMEWNKTYGIFSGQRHDYGYSVIQTVDGGYAFAGHVNSGEAGRYGDAWLVKTDSVGNMQWNNTFGGSARDLAESVVQTSDGGYAIAGWTESYSTDGSLYLVKTDEGGKMQWQETYPYGWGHSVIQTTDGGYATTGVNVLAKIDAAGNVQWNKTYNSPLVDENGFSGLPSDTYLYSVVQTRDGGYATAGEAALYPSSTLWLVKLDSEGNMQWLKTSTATPNGNSRGKAIVQTSDDGYAVAGYSRNGSYPESTSDMYLVKFAKDNPIPILSREPAGDVEANQPVKISASVTYPTSQINNVTVFYSPNNTGIWGGAFGGRIEMSLNTATNLYEASIPGLANGTSVRFRVVVYKIAEMSAAREASYTVRQSIPQEQSSPENQSSTTNSPVVHIIMPENKTYSVNEVPLTFTLDKPVVWMGYSLDGQETITITGNASIASLGNGPHNITVYAKDSFENVGTSPTVTFSVSKTAEENEQIPLEWFIVPGVLVAAIFAGFFCFKKKRKVAVTG